MGSVKSIDLEGLAKARSVTDLKVRLRSDNESFVPNCLRYLITTPTSQNVEFFT